MKIHDAEYLQKLSVELEQELRKGILPYWVENTVDNKNGGFAGRISFYNEPDWGAEKGSILTARILWTFSAAYKKFPDTEYQKMAEHAYQFLTGPLWDEVNKGVYWMVDAEGNPTEDRKHVYAEAFTIYALTEYYSAFGKEEALELAILLYSEIEKHCSDAKNGGYYEACSREWKVLDDVRLSDKDRNEPKSMNTHLHLLEAYTNLYRYWKSPDLKEKLTALIQIFEEHIINDSKTSLITFLGEDWTPRSDEISFGHDIETSWLLIEAAEVLRGYPHVERLIDSCLSIANHALNCGLDTEFGGLYNEGSPTGIVDDDKDWWPQAEAVVGFTNAFEYSGNEDYLHASIAIWEYIKKHFIDQKYGEWHEKLNRQGSPFEIDKVRSWKCPYHNGRMVLEMLKRLEDIQKHTYPAAEIADV